MIIPALILSFFVREGKTVTEIALEEGVPVRAEDPSICIVTTHPYLISTVMSHYPIYISVLMRTCHVYFHYTVY